MTKVSIIVPIYNMELYLKECLDSILSQTLKEIEVVCIDDGSTDRSWEILAEYAKADARILPIRQENQGVSTARNNGIKKASGKYLIFMDPDDWYPEKDILEVLFEKAENSGCQICGGEFSEYNDRTGEVRTEFPEQYFGYVFQKEGVIEYRDWQFDFGYHRFLYNREFILEHQLYFPKLIRFQDPPFFVKAMITAEKFYAVKKVVYRYRYGHRDLKWTREKRIALLKGIYMDMDMAVRNHLERLVDLTWFRMTEEFGEIICCGIIEGETEIEEWIRRVYDCLEIDRKEKYGYPFYRRFRDEVILLKEKQRKEDERLENEMKAIKNSITFRVGKYLLYIPRCIKLALWSRKKS